MHHIIPKYVHGPLEPIKQIGREKTQISLNLMSCFKEDWNVDKFEM